MDSESGLMDRYFRNASPQRLILYGVVVVGISVALILVFTLLFSSESATPTPAPKPAEFSGHDVLSHVPLVDGYNNLPVKLISELKGKINDFPFEKDLSSIKGYSWAKTDIPKLKTGQVGSQFWTVKSTCTSQFKDTVANTLQQIDVISRLTRKYKDDFKLVSSSNDVNEIFKEKKIGSILGIDGGHSIDNKLSVLRLYRTLGVTYMTLTSECDTPWSSSYATTSKTPSLSAFGEIIIKEMNRIGMIIDLSKSNIEVQKKVLDMSKAPVIFSSSNLYSIVKKDPNVQDEILEKLKKNNGIIMIAFNPNNMRKDSKDVVTIEHVVEQINYVLKKIGIDHIGLGSGFGTVDTTVKDLEDSSKYPGLFDRLAKSQGDEPKWGKEELEKLAYRNFHRVFEEVEKVKEEIAANEDLIPASDIPEASKSCYTAVQLYNNNAAANAA